MGRRSKDVLLLLLAVVALAVALYTFRRKPAAPTTKPPTASTQAQKGEQGTATGERPGPGGKPAGAASAAPGGGARNPFAGPSVPPAPGPKPAGAGGTSTPSRGAQVSVIAPVPGPSLPVVTPAPMPTGPKPGGQAGAQGQALTVVGIIAGRQTMAVIRAGDQRYYVRVGDRIGDRYRVQAIGSKDVVLASNEGKVILRMGGRQ